MRSSSARVRAPWATSFAAAMLLAALVASPARAESFCALFFDLGNTLVDQSVAPPYPLFADAQATIDELQAHGIALGVITNVPAGWDREDLEALLAQPEFLDEFGLVVLSSQAPAAKPDPAIYAFAHAALPAPTLAIGRTAFVGETLAEIANAESNPTLGARAAGMRGIHLSSGAASPLADFTVASLTALLGVATESCFVFLDGFESEGTGGWSGCTGCPP